jgi:DNA-binding transcriptional regulator YdaS (Cro superfamily)
MTGAELNDALDAIGWSQSELARRLGVIKPRVQTWVSGRVTVPQEVADWVARVATLIGQNPPPTMIDRRAKPPAA